MIGAGVLPVRRYGAVAGEGSDDITGDFAFDYSRLALVACGLWLASCSPPPEDQVTKEMEQPRPEPELATEVIVPTESAEYMIVEERVSAGRAQGFSGVYDYFVAPGSPAADPNPIHAVADDPVSTFSIDVDTASYASTRRFIELGQLPPPTLCGWRS